MLDSQFPWWRSAVIYQLYVRSFVDSGGDGIGDLGGVVSKLDYLARLGVDGLWLNPCYPSPQADHGYDIADFTDVNPDYGTLEVFDHLVTAAHERGLRVLMDIVPNHCSVVHPWFLEALAAAPGSPERDRFLFRDGRGPGGDEPPNNWRSVFGGPAWTRTVTSDGRPGQWYLHLFTSAQPDFNWRNPEVAVYFDEVFRFWFDRGVDGFRIDVAHGLVKDAELRDWSGGDYNEHSWNQPETHAIYRNWRALAAGYGPGRELMFVGEVWVPHAEDLAAYLRADELNQAFYFDLLMQPWGAEDFRASVDRAMRQLITTNAPITWTLANHDVHRAVSRYGLVEADPAPPSNDPFAAKMRPRGVVDVALGERRARAAILFTLALPGSVYLYQGEELGLPEVLDIPADRRRDPIFFRTAGAEAGRDGCRVPLPWASGEPTFGFSPAGAEEPWLPQPDWFGKYAVSEQEMDAGSTLNLYRRALKARRGLPEGEFAWREEPGPSVVAFTCRDITCVTNFGASPVELPAEWGAPIITSEPLVNSTLPGDATVWLRAESGR
ncbi:glycoside hydrolase family 13 protein [Amycolatopsis sp. NPDC004378]